MNTYGTIETSDPTAADPVDFGLCRWNVKDVQRMLGHASAAMTLDVYPSLFDDDLDGL